MIQAYKGYLKTEAHLIDDNNQLVTIPTNKIVTILWEEAGEVSTLAQRQNEAIKLFQVGIREIEDEPIDDEFRSIIDNGIIIESNGDL